LAETCWNFDHALVTVQLDDISGPLEHGFTAPARAEVIVHGRT
jgi:hypothetical protein